MDGHNLAPLVEIGRECVRADAAGAQTRRSLGHHLLHPLILRLLVLCAPAVLRTRALQHAPAPADPNENECMKSYFERYDDFINLLTLSISMKPW